MGAPRSRVSVTIREALDGVFAAWRSGDALRAAAFFTRDGIYRDERHEPIQGRDALITHFTRFFRDGPPWRCSVDDMLVDGLRAAVRFRFSIQLSSKDWRERPGCAFVTFEDGLISQWQEFGGA